MPKLDRKSTDNPKLMQKEFKNGTYSLYLEYYLGYIKTINEETGEEVARKIQLIGKPEVDDEGELIDGKIFNLPSQSMCLRSLKYWVKRAKIQKHITWHCARHSFVVNILNNGANIKTVASLLGHSGLQHTEKYTREVDELKQKAIDSLPELIV